MPESFAAVQTASASCRRSALEMLGSPRYRGQPVISIVELL
jgi:hypothetical protein